MLNREQNVKDFDSDFELELEPEFALILVYNLLEISLQYFYELVAFKTTLCWEFGDALM